MIQPKWVVLDAIPHNDYTIELSFADGTRGSYDAKPLLRDRFFSELESLPLFLTGHVECGTVVWDNDLDIAPEHLYEQCIPCA